MDKPSKPSLLITGIDGFTGFHLEKWFQNLGYLVFGTTFSKPNKENHFQCDITDKANFRNVLEEVRPSHIIHLAAISFVAEANAGKIYNTNVLGALNLMDALEELSLYPHKILVASSAAVYGNLGNSLDEKMCPKPVNHYGNSKLAMEHMLANYFDRQKIILARPFNYTGPGQEPHFLVPKIVSHFKEQKPLIELGNIDTFREYNDVGYVADIYSKLLVSDFHSGPVNIASGKTYSIKQILNELEALTGHQIEVGVNPKFVRKNEIKELKGSTDKLRSILQDFPNPSNLALTLKKMLG